MRLLLFALLTSLWIPPNSGPLIDGPHYHGDSRSITIVRAPFVVAELVMFHCGKFESNKRNETKEKLKVKKYVVRKLSQVMQKWKG